MGNNHILRNLHSLIRNSTLTYMNEFVWQDIELTTEFKTAFYDCLQEHNYDIEFFTGTAVITSPSTKYIFVPNQWFVIASYVVDVYEELQRYKEYFKKVAEKMHVRPEVYAKQLRDYATVIDRNNFIDCAKDVFASFCTDPNLVEEAASRLWRFVNDYSWWSGQKTIDRGDFYVSVILNMLNLVNVSQGYVADIVAAYANDYKLRNLVKSVDGFTINFDDDSERIPRDYIVPDEEIRNQRSVKKETMACEAIPKPERVRIKIDGTNKLKELTIKG